MADTLSADQVSARLADLPGWQGGPDGITKTFDCGDFVGAMGLVQQAALEAEKLVHHPDVTISYKNVTFSIVSHRLGGVTEQCFELADRIEQRAP